MTTEQTEQVTKKITNFTDRGLEIRRTDLMLEQYRMLEKQRTVSEDCEAARDKSYKLSQTRDAVDRTAHKVQFDLNEVITEMGSRGLL